MSVGTGNWGQVLQHLNTLPQSEPFTKEESLTSCSGFSGTARDFNRYVQTYMYTGGTYSAISFGWLCKEPCIPACTGMLWAHLNAVIRSVLFKSGLFCAQISPESEIKCNVGSIVRDAASYCALQETTKAFSLMSFQLKQTSSAILSAVPMPFNPNQTELFVHVASTFNQ